MNWPRPRRILLIHFGQLGDAVMAMPAAAALRRHFADAELTVLASAGGDEIYRMAGFAPVWTADRMRWKLHPWSAPPAILGLVARMRRAKFDLSVDLHSFHETNLLAWLAGVPRRVAMLRPTRSWSGLINDPPPADDPEGRLLDRYCKVLAPLGIQVRDRIPRLEPDFAARGKMLAAFTDWAGAGAVLGICPGAGNPGRCWPAERFAALAAGAQAPVAVFAGPEESPTLLAAFDRVPRARVWSGLTIPELAAALALCRVVVTNPTGPSHIAAAVGARVLTLGEIPAFDPVPVPPGEVRAVRAPRVVGDIGLDEVAGALRELWSAGPVPVD